MKLTLEVKLATESKTWSIREVTLYGHGRKRSSHALPTTYRQIDLFTMTAVLTTLPSPLPRSTNRVRLGCARLHMLMTLAICLSVAGTYGKQTLLRAGSTNGVVTATKATAAVPVMPRMTRPRADGWLSLDRREGELVPRKPSELAESVPISVPGGEILLLGVPLDETPVDLHERRTADSEKGTERIHLNNPSPSAMLCQHSIHRRVG